MLTLKQFAEIAADGVYREGDFDSVGLQRNIEALGYRCEPISGGDHEETMRQSDGGGLVSMFANDEARGCIVHQPSPRHWIALVPPVGRFSQDNAALLCDSLKPYPYALSVDELEDMFLAIGLRQAMQADMPATQWEREQRAAG